jgi:hypothetical protein
MVVAYVQYTVFSASRYCIWQQYYGYVLCAQTKVSNGCAAFLNEHTPVSVYNTVCTVL